MKKLLLLVFTICGCCLFAQHPVFISPKIDTNNVRNKAILELWQEYLQKRFDNTFQGQTNDLSKYWAESELVYKSFDFYREQLLNLDYFYVYTPSYALQIDSIGTDMFSLQIMTMQSDKYWDTTVKCEDYYPSALFSVKVIKDSTSYKLANALTLNKAKKQTYQTSVIRYYYDKDYPFDTMAVSQAHQKLLDFSEKYQLSFLEEPLIEFFVYPSFSQMNKDFGFDMHPFYQSVSVGGRQIAANRMVFYGGAKAEANIHEIIHILLRQITPAPTMLEEGICTYYGGSIGKSYEEQKAGLIRYLENNPKEPINIFDFPEDYGYNHSYTVMAVLVEYIEKQWGVERVLEMLKFEAKEKGGDEEVFRNMIKTYFELEESEFASFLRKILDIN